MSRVPAGIALPAARVLHRFHVLFKHAHAMAVTILVVLAGAAVYTFLVTPLYRATAVVGVEHASEAQLSALRGRELKRDVVRRLHLVDNREFMQPARLAFLDERTAALKRGTIELARSWLARSGYTAPLAHASTNAVPAPGREHGERPDEIAAIDRIQAGMIVQPARNDRQFAITFSSPFPNLAALVANELAAAYRDLQAAQKTSAVDKPAAEIEIIARATRPTRPYTPDVARNLVTALFAGIALAILLAVVLEYFDDTLATPEDVARDLSIPLFGAITAVRPDRQPVLSGPVSREFSEAYRSLRASLMTALTPDAPHIVVCTSAQALDGKTTTACNLAMVLAFGGSRVLLVDADMRQPAVHSLLNMTNAVGLSHVLAGQARLREAIQRSNDSNFCVMTAGTTPVKPSELLGSERMKQLIANLRRGPFDWVVIDTPAVLAIPDANVLAPTVDAVAFVVGSELTGRRAAERAIRMIQANRPKVIGAVLNRMHASYAAHSTSGHGFQLTGYSRPAAQPPHG